MRKSRRLMRHRWLGKLKVARRSREYPVSPSSPDRRALGSLDSAHVSQAQ